MTLNEQMTRLAKQAKAASRELAKLTTGEKNACLLAMATALEQNADALKEANALDMEAAAKSGRLSSAMLDRLKLDDKRIAAMAKGLREVEALADPVGRILDERVRPNGLKLQKISTPIGVVVIIYESRPNVTADAAGLCFKSGNATILRGGKEALNSNQLIAKTMIEAGKIALKQFPEHAIQVVPVTDREVIPILLSLTQYIDLCMPRGGEGLIRAVADCSKVPVIKHYKGVCHVYVDADADLKMAGGNRDERQMPASRRLQRDGNAAGGQKNCGAIFAGHWPATQRKESGIARGLRCRSYFEMFDEQYQIRHQTGGRTGLVHRIQRLHPECARRGRRPAGD